MPRFSSKCIHQRDVCITPVLESWGCHSEVNINPKLNFTNTPSLHGYFGDERGSESFLHYGRSSEHRRRAPRQVGNGRGPQGSAVPQAPEASDCHTRVPAGPAEAVAARSTKVPTGRENEPRLIVPGQSQSVASPLPLSGLQGLAGRNGAGALACRGSGFFLVCVTTPPNPRPVPQPLPWPPSHRASHQDEAGVAMCATRTLLQPSPVRPPFSPPRHP